VFLGLGNVKAAGILASVFPAQAGVFLKLQLLPEPRGPISYVFPAQAGVFPFKTSSGKFGLFTSIPRPGGGVSNFTLFSFSSGEYSPPRRGCFSLI
jgi:hypothetical protein